MGKTGKMVTKGRVGLNLQFVAEDLGEDENLTKWEQNVLDGIRRLCRSSLDRNDLMVETNGARLQLLWQISPEAGDIQEPDFDHPEAGPCRETLTLFEYILLNDIRAMVQEGPRR